MRALVLGQRGSHCLGLVVVHRAASAFLSNDGGDERRPSTAGQKAKEACPPRGSRPVQRPAPGPGGRATGQRGVPPWSPCAGRALRGARPRRCRPSPDRRAPHRSRLAGSFANDRCRQARPCPLRGLLGPCAWPLSQPSAASATRSIARPAASTSGPRIGSAAVKREQYLHPHSPASIAAKYNDSPQPCARARSRSIAVRPDARGAEGPFRATQRHDHGTVPCSLTGNGLSS